MDTETHLSEGVSLCRRGPRLTIRLNNPAVHNRLSGSDIGCLRKVFTEINSDTDIRVVVLTGTGKSFCAGFDLGELAGLAADARLPDFDHLSQRSLMTGLTVDAAYAALAKLYGDVKNRPSQAQHSGET